MAPSFIQKLVKATTSSNNGRERGNSDASPRQSTTTRSRSQSASTSNANSISSTSNVVSAPNSPASNASSTRRFTGDNRIPSIMTFMSPDDQTGSLKPRQSIDSVDTGHSSHPNVTIVPPSPMVNNADLDDSDEEDSPFVQQVHTRTTTAGSSSTPAQPSSADNNNTRGAPNTTPDDDGVTPTPTPIAPQPPLPSTTSPTSALSNMASLVPGMYGLRNKSSNRSMTSFNNESNSAKKSRPADITVSTTSINGTANHPRAATSPPDVSGSSAASRSNTTGSTTSSGTNGTTSTGATSVGAPPGNDEPNSGGVTKHPIVESPTSDKFPHPPPPIPTMSPTSPPTRSQTISGLLRTDTSATVSGNGEKKGWRKASTQRKPTGLASAIAASGLAMANTTMSAAVQKQHEAIVPSPAAVATSMSGGSSNTSGGGPGGNTGDVYIHQGKHSKSRSAELSPRTPKSRKSSIGSSGAPNKHLSPKKGGDGGIKRSRRTSQSAMSDNASEYYAPNGSVIGVGNVEGGEYYTRLDLDLSDEEEVSTRRRRSSKSNSRRRGTAGSGTLSVGASNVGSRSGSGSEFSGSEDLSGSGSEESGSEDEVSFGEEDIPVTGFAVASNKRNADFHELFPGVPEGDYLIEDYGCALQREILIQGRIYISENHICFHANIFGWITDLSIPIYEITSLEKKMTAFVIPNAIQITTRQAKYTFASFLSRDTTYDVIYNIWRLARPDENTISKRGIAAGNGGVGGGGGPGDGGGTPGGGDGGEGPANNSSVPAGAKSVAHGPTRCACDKDKLHYSETALDTVIPGTPEKIYNLMFASGFMKEFMAGPQKLMDIQMSDWQPMPPDNMLARNMSYIKPLNGSLGPKQTKCEIKDQTTFCDFDKYVSMLTTTRTPEVPSGGVFSVKTRTCIMWENAVSSRVIVTTQVEWTGRSFIKGIIERSAIDGQKTYHSELERAMRHYISQHQSEFLPEGVAVEPEAEVTAAGEAAGGDATSANAPGDGEKKLGSSDEEFKRRERERNTRALQWAWDTFDGAYQVALRSTKGAVELVRDAWDQSSSTTILWFVIVILVLSNLWTLFWARGGGRAREVEMNRRIEAKRAEEREKWVQSIVTALWEELATGKREGPIPVAGGGSVGSVGGGAQDVLHHARQIDPIDLLQPEPAFDPNEPVSTTADAVVQLKHWREEVIQLQRTLDSLERKVKVIREGLHKLDVPLD
ncbi:hypothetical protein CVT24_000236 [Panaeolus cyanescens]|uniref:VASt domain-containing protein n=1 Tax=Panaeolus cyanescens TaxID=181874 RepID=A0A409VIF3_9AGAR|nr:hypothetical protein CVT24_000236 [Panaeolus cyanescens]